MFLLPPFPVVILATCLACSNKIKAAASTLPAFEIIPHIVCSRFPLLFFGYPLFDERLVVDSSLQALVSEESPLLRVARSKWGNVGVAKRENHKARNLPSTKAQKHE